ncbi:MAG: hypothetical protein LIR40_15635 [Bacteroidota bacterium]|nr:hypothetical protein [Bacteroidota bacterium]
MRQRELRAGVRAAIRARKAVKAMKAAVKVKPDAFTDEQIKAAEAGMMCRHVAIKS